MTITIEQVREAITKVCTDNPTKVNPIGVNDEGDASCLYLDSAGQRCIGGEVVWLLTGYSIPADNFCGILVVAREANLGFDADALTLLNQTQQTADNMRHYVDDDGESTSEAQPRPWREVLDILTDIGSV